jgi:hypothetical protein
VATGNCDGCIERHRIRTNEALRRNEFNLIVTADMPEMTEAANVLRSIRVEA